LENQQPFYYLVFFKFFGNFGSPINDTQAVSSATAGANFNSFSDNLISPVRFFDIVYPPFSYSIAFFIFILDCRLFN